MQGITTPRRRPPPAWRAAALRPILFLHRWLGVALGLVMLVWSLSGFVMMYVDYPRLSPTERLQGLEPLSLTDGHADLSASLPADTPLNGIRIEMLDGRPVLRLQPAGGRSPQPGEQMRATPLLLDLSTGMPPPPLTPEQVRVLADGFGRRAGIVGSARPAERIEADQWSVQYARRHQPLYRVMLDDEAGSSLYIAGASGEIVQQSTRFERAWGWLGAVPHWLYPTLLRQNGDLWSQVVIWSSLAGCFLTVTGLVVGLVRLKRRDGSLSVPYRGLWRWHHITGLLAGPLTLTWVASGLLSMNPWGVLDSHADMTWRARLHGPLLGGDAALMADLAPRLSLPPGTVMLDAVKLGGRLHVVALPRQGPPRRFDDQGQATELTAAELRTALGRAGADIAGLTLLTQPDDYHYAHKGNVALPVWQVRLADADGTLLYIDAVTGALLRAVDAPARAFRWWQDGLHRLDFAWMRSRPLWDMLVIPALAAVTLLCATGTWMGFRRLRRTRRRQKGQAG